MIYSLCYSLDGIYGPGGGIYRKRREAVACAVDLSKTALDTLADWVHDADWFDASGDLTDASSLFATEGEDELANAISQVSDAMKGQGIGFIDIVAHDNLFALIDHHHMDTWLSAQLCTRIKDVKSAYDTLESDISDEWRPA